MSAVVAQLREGIPEGEADNELRSGLAQDITAALQSVNNLFS